MNNDLLKEWKRIAKEIIKYDKMYERGESLISDNLYDSLYDRLVEIEEIIGPQKNSPTNKIIANNLVNKITHLEPMLSLERGFGVEALENFAKRMEKNEIFPLIAEHKVDGVSVALRYENGVLTNAITRGNGEFGTDITRQIKFVEFPRAVEDRKLFEVRGELYMNNSDFVPLADRFSSPRNACASIVQNKNVVGDVKINFMAHNYVLPNASDNHSDQRTEPEYIHYHSECMNHIAEMGFSIVPHKILNNLTECTEYFAEITNNRNIIPYNIDGVVFKINNKQVWKTVGYNRKHPRYAIAIKFDPISKETVLRDVVMQVGKFGTITPVAVFDTITIEGHNISRATLHNIEEIQQKNYGPGDKIIISRSGDTIPYVKQKIFDANNPVEIKICPSCGTELQKVSRDLICPAGWDCQAQRILRIEHFCSKNAFNIDGIGPKAIEDLVVRGYIFYPTDVLNLPSMIAEGKINLSKLPNWNSKSIQNLLNSINNAREISFANYLYGLCIPNVGFGNARTIADYFKNLTEFRSYYASEIPHENGLIKGIGDVVTTSIKGFIAKNPWIFEDILLDRLKEQVRY